MGRCALRFRDLSSAAFWRLPMRCSHTRALHIFACFFFLPPNKRLRHVHMCSRLTASSFPWLCGGVASRQIALRGPAQHSAVRHDTVESVCTHDTPTWENCGCIDMASDKFWPMDLESGVYEYFVGFPYHILNQSRW